MTYKRGDVVVGVDNVPEGWLFTKGDKEVRLKIENEYLRIDSPGKYRRVNMMVDPSKLKNTRLTLVADISAPLYSALYAFQTEVMK